LDFFSSFNIDDLKFQEEEEKNLHSDSELKNIELQIQTDLIFITIISQPYYSIQNIKGYDFFVTMAIYIQSLSEEVISWHHEYLIYSGHTLTEKTSRTTITWPGL
jgi:hypothetical protein